MKDQCTRTNRSNKKECKKKIKKKTLFLQKKLILKNRATVKIWIYCDGQNTNGPVPEMDLFFVYQCCTFYVLLLIVFTTYVILLIACTIYVLLQYACSIYEQQLIVWICMFYLCTTANCVSQKKRGIRVYTCL